MSALLFSWTWAHALVLPFGDGWTWIAQAKGWHEGGFDGWWREHPIYHTQHLYFVPAVIALVLGPLVDFSFRPFAFLGVFLLVALGAAGARWARRNDVSHLEALFVFAIAVSFRHYENLLIGFQIGLIACVLFGVLAVYVAGTRPGGRGAILAFALALLSGLSSSAGMATCLVVVLMRVFHVRRARTWALIALLGATIVWAIDRALVQTYYTSFITDGVKLIQWDRADVVFMATLQLLGGGVVGGELSGWLGVLVLAGTIHLVARSLDRSGGIDTAAGMALLGCLCCATVALARAPLLHVESRYAVFAFPSIASCLTEFLVWLRPRRTVFASAAIGVLLAWLQLQAARATEEYIGAITRYEHSVRITLAKLGTSGKLTHDELYEVNPAPRDLVLDWVRFVRDRRWLIFSPTYSAVRTYDGLPKSFSRTNDAREEDGVLHFRGPGHAFSTLECANPEGSFARLEVVAQASGPTAIGLIERDPSGAEVHNFSSPFPVAGEFRRHTLEATAGPGNVLEPYVYVERPEDTVSLKSLVVVVGKNSPLP